ncbi:MAG: DUF3891 family protein [Oligoflexales bacterium]
MIVTSADSCMGLVSLQIEHQRVALQLARKFGNHSFTELNPREHLEHLCGHLDEGWSQTDFETPNDPALGLPYDFRFLPFEQISRAWEKTISQLAAYHPFCGILASQLYCRHCESCPNSWQDELVRHFIEAETRRQNKLKLSLSKEFLTEHYTNSKLLETSLAQLVFFDVLALDLISPKSDGRRYIVPRKEGEGQVLTLVRVSQSAYSLSPFPFIGNKIEVCIRRFRLPSLKNQTALNYSNILPELEQVIDTIQIIRKTY